jgi:hypothetical protein
MVHKLLEFCFRFQPTFSELQQMGFGMTRATVSRTNHSTLPETSDEIEAWVQYCG